MKSVLEKIKRDTEALALPRGRRVGEPGHDVACDYLLIRMSQIGLVPFRGNSFALPYALKLNDAGAMNKFTNLAGVIRGTEEGLAPLLIGAHYDSVIDAPCADDNATAVAAILAVAERLQTNPVPRDVIVSIFDAEEPPFFLSEAMGSVRFYEDHCGGMNFSCVIILDLIGHEVELGDASIGQWIPQLKDLLFVLGSESHRELPGVVEQAARRVSGIRMVPTLNEYIGDMSDHHAFRLGGQPYLFLTCGPGRFYHTPNDDLRWIQWDKVVRVQALVYELLAASQALNGPDPAQPHDPVEFEVRFLSQAFGTALPQLLQLVGLSSLRTRSDLTGVVRTLAQSLRV
jgi:hypothetical protein